MKLDDIDMLGIYWSLAMIALLLLVAFMCHRRTKRNRWLDSPQRDDRDSIQAFRKIIGRH